VSAKIRALTAFGKPRSQVFGAQEHRWLLEPRLHHTEVAALEKRIGIQFPTDYREFITHVAAGGLGPAYGLRSVKPAMAASAHLDQPFPWTAYFNPSDGRRDDERDWDREAAGTLALCDEGCGHSHRLVVTGPAHGTMWIDSRGSDQGFIPLGASFISWYERWLDHALAGGNGVWWLS
jgi:hypothetical protein